MTKVTSSSNGHIGASVANIGEYLKYLRENCGLTQGAAAAEIGIHGTHLGHMENGHQDPSPKYLKGLSRVYIQSDANRTATTKTAKALYLRMMVIAGYLVDSDLAITPTTSHRDQLQSQLDTAKAVVAELEAKLRAYDVLFGTASGVGVATAAEATQGEGE